MPRNFAASACLPRASSKGLPDRLHPVALVPTAKGSDYLILPHHLEDHVRLNGILPADGNDPFDGILQFPDVAGPGVPDEDFHGGPAEPQAAIELSCVFLQEGPGILLDILGPFPKRREVEAQDVQPVVQVGAERLAATSSLRFLLVAAMRRMSMGRTRSLPRRMTFCS